MVFERGGIYTYRAATKDPPPAFVVVVVLMLMFPQVYPQIYHDADRASSPKHGYFAFCSLPGIYQKLLRLAQQIPDPARCARKLVEQTIGDVASVLVICLWPRDDRQPNAKSGRPTAGAFVFSWACPKSESGTRASFIFCPLQKDYSIYEIYEIYFQAKIRSTGDQHSALPRHPTITKNTNFAVFDGNVNHSRCWHSGLFKYPL